MKVANDIKKEQIVEAALRRFSHFGIAKTTFTEVAEDLGISKQVLSYYFHDKQSLVLAVTDKLTTEYGIILKNEMETATTAKAALLKLTDVKGIFYEKYFMLLSHAEHLEIMRNQISSNWNEFLTNKENGLLTRMFEKAVQTGELKPLDAPKTAQLLLETLYAFSKCVAIKADLPETADFKGMLTKQQEVISLFYQGLKSNTWKNQ